MDGLVDDFVTYLEPYIGYAYAHAIKHLFILIAGLFIGFAILMCFYVSLWVGVRTKEDIGKNLLAVRASFKGRSSIFVAPSFTFLELFNTNLAIISLRLSRKDDFREKDLRKARFLFYICCLVALFFVYSGLTIAMDVSYLPNGGL